MKSCLLVCLLCWAGMVSAELRCDVDLAYGVIVNGERLRVVDHSRTLYQINGGEQLIVQGNLIPLTPEQKRELKKLFDGLQYSVPRLVLLASEGVELAIDTVEQVYLGLVGQEHSSTQRLQRALKRVRKKVNMKFFHASDNYFIGPGRLERMDELVDSDIEAKLEAAIQTSVGGVLSAIGGLQTDNPASAAKLAALSERLGDLGVNLGNEVGPQADTLKQKAAWFCKEIKQLNQAEEALRNSVPAMQPFNLIKS